MKTLLTFHYTGWFIGILILAYYNPHIVSIVPYIKQPTRVFSTAHVLYDLKGEVMPNRFFRSRRILGPDESLKKNGGFA